MPDEGSTFLSDRAGLFKILMLTGAVIGVLSVFMSWFSIDYVFFRFDYAGYDFYLKSFDYPDNYPGIGYYAYMPFIVLGSSILAAVFSVLSFFTRYEKKGAILATVLGMVMLVSTLLYVFYPESNIVISNSSAVIINEMRLLDHLGGGVYSAFIACMFLILGGILILVFRGRSGLDPKAE